MMYFYREDEVLISFIIGTGGSLTAGFKTGEAAISTLEISAGKYLRIEKFTIFFKSILSYYCRKSIALFALSINK